MFYKTIGKKSVEIKQYAFGLDLLKLEKQKLAWPLSISMKHVHARKKQQPTKNYVRLEYNLLLILLCFLDESCCSKFTVIPYETPPQVGERNGHSVP